MRLMQAPEGGAAALECLYCGAQEQSGPPYAVVYCHCRSYGVERHAPGAPPHRRALARTAARRQPVSEDEAPGERTHRGPLCV